MNGKIGTELAVPERYARRFWPKVQKGDGCWLWQAGVSTDGYGSFGVRGLRRRAHRVAWALTNGPIPEGVQVLHRCDVPLCVNPDHLFLGGYSDNVRDCVAKGRHNRPKGEHHHRAKLTEEKVREARRLHADGVPLPELAARYGVTRGTVYDVVSGRRWQHVG